MRLRVCDLIAARIAQENVDRVFMVSGGGLLYLTDGLYQAENLNVICCHHEQAAAMAAVGYAKYKGFGCAYVTTGCGGTNAVTGVLDAWQDNAACLFVSGQCKRKETIRYRGLNIRQLGVQEADIVEIVKPITKYAVMITDPENALFELEKAIYIAKEGRQGPCWIDVPMDIQSAWVDTEKLQHYVPEEKPISSIDLSELKQDLKNAKRPVILAGGGIRKSGTVEQFRNFVRKHQIPVVWSRLGADALPTTDSLNIGSIGNKGIRSANFAVQNADLVLVLGSRLSVSSTGQEYHYFARKAKVVVVDIDQKEHQKNTVHIEKLYNMDLKDFFQKTQEFPIQNYDSWVKQCQKWFQQYPVCLPEYYDTELVNLYAFVEELSKQLREQDVLVTDSGSTSYVPPQAMKMRGEYQRYITASAQGEMGFALPASIGVSAARGGGETLAIIGDGSFQMNIQELQTLKYNEFPVKLFIWNNDGYLSIRSSQNRMFDGRQIGTDSRNGVSFPNLEKISEAYGLKYIQISNTAMLAEKIKEVLAYEGPVLCEVMCLPNQQIAPTVSSRQLEDGTLVSSPIEDMAPFLPREELAKQMLIPMVTEE